MHSNGLGNSGFRKISGFNFTFLGIQRGLGEYGSLGSGRKPGKPGFGGAWDWGNLPTLGSDHGKGGQIPGAPAWGDPGFPLTGWGHHFPQGG